jgi:hypothetical protein
VLAVVAVTSSDGPGGPFAPNRSIFSLMACSSSRTLASIGSRQPDVGRTLTVPQELGYKRMVSWCTRQYRTVLSVDYAYKAATRPKLLEGVRSSSPKKRDRAAIAR